MFISGILPLFAIINKLYTIHLPALLFAVTTALSVILSTLQFLLPRITPATTERGSSNKVTKLLEKFPLSALYITLKEFKKVPYLYIYIRKCNLYIN